MKQERDWLLPIFLGLMVALMIMCLVLYKLDEPPNSTYYRGWMTNTPEVQTTLDRRLFIGSTPTPYATATNFCQLPICKEQNR